MGASDSSSVVVSKPTTESSVSGFHVKVTFDGKEILDRQGDTIEDHIEQAFATGKDTGAETIKRSLDAVAAQVYDNIKLQMADMDAKGNKNRELMEENLKSKLSIPVGENKCESESIALTACWQDGKEASFMCGDLIKAYRNCSAQSLNIA